MKAQQVADLISGLGLEPDEENMLDVLWLAQQISPPASAETSPGDSPRENLRENSPETSRAAEAAASKASSVDRSRDAAVQSARASLYSDAAPNTPALGGRRAGTVRSPAAAALGGQLELARAMRPLKRRISSRHHELLDEYATASRIAEDGLWIPEMRPAPTRWLELAVVVDGYESMSIWRQMLTELRGFLERLGAFSDVRFWVLNHAADDSSHLSVSRWRRDSALRSVHELADPSGRRVIVVVSDCLGPSWRSGAAQRVLARWGRSQPVAIWQPLPQRLWSYTYVQPTAVRLRATRAGAPNADLNCDHVTRPTEAGGHAPVPVLELDAPWLASWSRLINAAGTSGVDAIAAFADRADMEDRDNAFGRGIWLSAEDRVRRFRATASPDAFRLAVCVAAAPVTLPIIRLIQRVMLHTDRSSLLAELFLGGLLQRVGHDSGTDPDQVQYDFLPGVRDNLLASLHRNDAMQVLLEVSDYVDLRFGQARDFRALLAGAEIAGDQPINVDSMPFAVVAESVLRRLGGQYSEPAELLAGACGTGQALSAASVEVTPTDVGSGKPDDLSPFLSGVPLPVHRSRERPLVCPYCYRAFAEDEILFRCSGRPGIGRAACVGERDRVLEEETGETSLLPPAFAGRGHGDEAVCPVCGVPSRAQVCPGCHSRLPADFRSVQGRLIALVGPSYSGKSLFMTVLIHELCRDVGERLNASTIGADDTSKRRFVTEYETPLYKMSELIKETRTATRRNIPPLVFRFTMDQRTRFRPRRKELLLSFTDGAGADLISPLKADLVARYLAAADGVLALVDPLQLPTVRSLLAARMRIPPALTQDQRPDAAFDRITRFLLAGSGGAAIDKPVAIVLSKLDAVTDLLPSSSVLHKPGPVGPYFDTADGAAVQDEVKTMLNEWNAARIDQIASRSYRRYRYFAVSSLGSAPTPDNRISADGIQPRRVADPFLWLLNQFSFIPAR